ncbi:MAG TPA: hypothetical protein VKC57_01290 [Ktedonobacterales bacterium]|nr:hypothetical protein [Ktedonobacterales bacterium]
MERQQREALEREREADEHPSPLQLRLRALMEERRRSRVGGPSGTTGA